MIPPMMQPLFIPKELTISSVSWQGVRDMPGTLRETFPGFHVLPTIFSIKLLSGGKSLLSDFPPVLSLKKF